MYTADSLYQMSANQCNGIVTSFSQAPGSTVMIAACSDHGNWNNLQQMAEVAGRYQGQSAAAARNNHVMAMLTANGTFPCWRNCLSHRHQYCTKCQQQIPHGPYRCGGDLLLVGICRPAAAFFPDQ
ncbi:hypothetical protein [Delftia tsuruhatensis]|uniref:hypothetical protein n=1 Tax=Delftia tsuruhatensis TaxID=180282 RepID=UPI001D1166F1|nr:hypothetical protein [Delftia tsuruhatensis]